MIRLKNILSEIETERGNLNEKTGANLFDDVFIGSRTISYIMEVFEKGFYFVERAKQMNKLMVDAANKNKKMPKEIRDKIIKSFGKVILSKGDLFITVDYAHVYHLFDFSKPVNLLSKSITGETDETWFETNFYVGHIQTKKIDTDIYYSPKKQLGLSNVYQILVAEVGKEYRGQGYGSMLYDAVANSVDAIYSDDTLYKGSLSMWTNHMRKKAKFFGVISSFEDKVIIPLSGEITKKVIENASGFVCIFKNVPAKLIEMKKFLSGIPMEQIDVGDPIENADISLKTMIDAIEESVSLNDLHKELGIWQTENKYTVSIYLHEKVTIVVKEVGDELEYMLI